MCWRSLLVWLRGLNESARPCTGAVGLGWSQAASPPPLPLPLLLSLPPPRRPLLSPSPGTVHETCSRDSEAERYGVPQAQGIFKCASACP